jgi:anti-sigma factor RsiW
MINNKQWKLRTSAWFDGECSDIDSAEVRSHLLEDNAARLEVQQWRNLRADLQLLQPEAVSDACVKRIKNRFQDGLSHEIYTYAKAVQWLNIAAALLLALSIGGWIAVNSKAPGIEVYAQESNQLDQAIHDFLSRPASSD